MLSTEPIIIDSDTTIKPYNTGLLHCVTAECIVSLPEKEPGSSYTITCETKRCTIHCDIPIIGCGSKVHTLTMYEFCIINLCCGSNYWFITSFSGDCEIVDSK